MIRYPRDRHLKLHLKLDLPLIDQVPHAMAASVSGIASPSMLRATDDDFQSPNFTGSRPGVCPKCPCGYPAAEQSLFAISDGANQPVIEDQVFSAP